MPKIENTTTKTETADSNTSENTASELIPREAFIPVSYNFSEEKLEQGNSLSCVANHLYGAMKSSKDPKTMVACASEIRNIVKTQLEVIKMGIEIQKARKS